MTSYVEELERRIERLELALEANKKNFHVLTPDEKYVLTEPFLMVDRYVCSFSRELNRILYLAGKTSPIWQAEIDIGYNIGSTCKQKFDLIKYTIPVGTTFTIKCYEVKKRKTVSPEHDFVRTVVDYYPGVPEAQGKILNLKRKDFTDIRAELYIDYPIDNQPQ